MGYRYYTNLVFVKREYLAANRPIVVGYLKGLTRGWMENAKDPAVAAKLVVDKYGADLGLDLKQQTRQNQLQIEMLKNPDKPNLPFLVLDKETLAGPMYAAAKASGRENLPPIDKLCDYSVMEEVHAALKKS
jgi:ABC-type nitrate/sulfonate/bicarbonate transport system substrate-binding protein